MRQLFRALVCVGSLAALSAPISAAQATDTSGASFHHCRVAAAHPIATTKTFRAAAVRTGCATKAHVQVKIKKVLRGPDRTVRLTKKVVRNAKITTSVRCTTQPHTYYVVVTDSQGHTAHSKPVRLSCLPKTHDQKTSTGSSTEASTGGSIGTAVEQEVVKLTNDARRAQGCAALTNDAKLHTAALGHSKDMAAKDYFSHISQDGRTPTDRIDAAGFSARAFGENIAWGQRTPTEVVNTWLDSPGHRANIMNCAYTHIGVGVAQGAKGLYWTQDFAAH